MFVTPELLNLSQCYDKLHEEYLSTGNNNVRHQMDLVQKELNQMAGRRYAQFLREEDRPAFEARV